jgi:predicted kinase
MEKILYIVRGLPSSGKSTFAKSLVKSKDYCHKEADMFFIDDDGNYNFNPSKLKEAHQWCQEEIEFLMRLGHTSVVVSNTFTQEWEMEPYNKLAEKYNYIVFSVIIENRHGGVNTHGVPEDTIEKMKNRFEIKL